MISLFHSIKRGKKGQLASLLMVVLVAVLILAFVSVNLGKLGLNRTKTSNAADSAALAAGSSASQLLNYMASYNDMMLLNFSGFVTQILLVMIMYIVDVTTVMGYISAAYTAHKGGTVAVTPLAEQGVYALASLELTMLTIILLIDGAESVGGSLEDRIRELNVKLPKNTRNTLRQYGFMNTGIDESKISYSDWLAETGNSNSDSAWEEYLKVETGFDAFTRTLINTNNADSNYGPNSLLSYSWQDKHREQLVNNTVNVYSTPMPSLSLDTKDFQDVANNSGLRSEMESAIDDVDLSWWLETWVDLGLAMAPLVYVFLTLVVQIVGVLVLILSVYSIASVATEVVYALCCACCECPYCCCCVTAPCLIYLPGILTYLRYLAAWIPLAASIAATSATIDPSDIPCLVYGNDSNDLTVSAEIRRLTVPASGALNYGLWSMQYPNVTAYSRAQVFGSGGGKLFPPVTDYNAQIIQTR